MTCEVRNKEINSQCAELLVRPLYIKILAWACDASHFSADNGWKNLTETLENDFNCFPRCVILDTYK